MKLESNAFELDIGLAVFEVAVAVRVAAVAPTIVTAAVLGQDAFGDVYTAVFEIHEILFHAIEPV